MTPLGFFILLVCALLLLSLPQRMAIVPLLCGYLYMTVGQSLRLGGLNLYAIRVLILVGLLRLLFRGERVARPWLGMDKAMAAWALVALATSLLHQDPGPMFINRGGLVLNQLGVYLLFRSFLQTEEDALAACKYCITCLVPLAVLLAFEHFTLRNPFAILGGVPELAVERAGRFRAQGPFGNAINAGLAGSMILPFAALAWPLAKPLAWLGLGTALTMVVFSASSTPVSAAGVIVLGLGFWRFRGHLRQSLWLGIFVFAALGLLMKAPIYYLIARIDFAGGSTGYHRALIIESAIDHLKDWWLYGSDYTRDWTPYGLEGNPNHADITNHYIMNGVMGGLPMMACLLATIWFAFQGVMAIYRQAEGRDPARTFLGWVLGVTLVAHCASFLGVTYYDQLLGLWYLHLAIIAALWPRAGAHAPATPALVAAPIPTFLDSAQPGTAWP